MTDENKQEAADLAKRAGTQAKNAAKNSGRAVKAVAEPVIEAVVEEASNGHRQLEAITEEAAHTAKRVNPRMLSYISGDTGIGFLALSASLYAACVAVAKFRDAYEGRKQVLS